MRTPNLHAKNNITYQITDPTINPARDKLRHRQRHTRHDVTKQTAKSDNNKIKMARPDTNKIKMAAK